MNGLHDTSIADIDVKLISCDFQLSGLDRSDAFNGMHTVEFTMDLAQEAVDCGFELVARLQAIRDAANGSGRPAARLAAIVDVLNQGKGNGKGKGKGNRAPHVIIVS